MEKEQLERKLADESDLAFALRVCCAELLLENVANG
jgi:hypothetical protein